MPPPPSPPLAVNVFTAPEKTLAGAPPYPFGPPLSWDPITATLIYGETDAVLVDALTTTAEATALADWIALHHRTLTTIYLTHGHFDHFYGLSVLLQRFPNAEAIATPESVQLMRDQLTPQWHGFATALFPDQLPAQLVAAQPFTGDTFTLEGHDINIVKQGRTDTVDTTSIHVPAIDLVVGGDVVYNQCHMFVGDTTPESRANWIAALDRLEALNPATVVAGHKKTGAPDTPDALAASKEYLADFDRLVKRGNSEQHVYDEMISLYPNWVSPQSWLMFHFPELKRTAQ
ncbi:MBL fold metallo-hydrolase [Mycolicibacterium sp. 050158]|uniref:MBL fold metallo-hydrolase n=1 Tax=Mycolicibacterium sp. 050158 TaxID=3090602 RepID=UPI00299E95D7|nr:MBL fold metallo-hydrolase [Mycolicibacterium sp. 050158]MDX1892671.1 MBL fold metallo-hydrolase [Mycolicibacterium sp. 050158]